MNENRTTFTAEQQLIESIKKWTGHNYIGDDCAVLPGRMLVSSDTLVEGTHFQLSLTSLADLGFKAVSVNLSDIAAMAGEPRQLLVNLTLPPGFSKSQFRQIFSAMLECARAYRTEIVGGDLTRGPILVISVTVIGHIHERGCLLRSGARPGDVVVVSGDFGASAAGFWVAKSGKSNYSHVRQAHFKPTPKLSESWQIVRHTGNRGSLMDASDGLADALIQISRASATAIEIDPALIPIHKETIACAKLAGVDPLDWALYGGEDYQLVATLEDSDWQELARSKAHGFTAIGKVNEGSGVFMKGFKNKTLDLSKTFQHWDDIS